MQTILFSPNADSLLFDIRFTGLIGGSYRATLFEKNSDTVITEFSGNNQQTDNDTFPFPLPLLDNDGRVIELWALYSAIDDKDIGGNFSITVNILQTTDGVESTILSFSNSGKILVSNPAYHEFILLQKNL